MLLAVDIGNTSITFGIFDKLGWLELLESARRRGQSRPGNYLSVGTVPTASMRRLSAALCRS